jgi:hypothetical protein
MIADRSHPRQFAHCKSPVNPGLASLSPGTAGAAGLRTAPDERVRPRSLETVMPYAITDCAPDETTVHRPRWPLHGGAARLLRVATLLRHLTVQMAAPPASPTPASSKRSLLPGATLSTAAESRLVSVLQSTATTTARPSAGTTGRHRLGPGLIQPRHSSTFPTFQLVTLRDFR